jgi:hypothetical protein
MIHKNFRAVIVIIASSLCASAVLSLALTTSTAPNQMIVLPPMELAMRSTTQNPPNGTPSAKQQPKAPQPAQAPAGPVPPLIKTGIAALVSAKASLEKAGDKWGGHRVKAITLIDQALKACGQTQTHTKGEMTSGSTDDTTSMQAATTELTTAQKDFTNSKSTWGGRRDQALPLINQALQELQLAATAASGPKKSG